MEKLNGFYFWFAPRVEKGMWVARRHIEGQKATKLFAKTRDEIISKIEAQS